MAVSQAPSPRTSREARPEIRIEDFEPGFELRGESEAYRSLASRSGQEESHVRELGERIALVPEPAKNETQLKFDRNVVTRYEGMIERAEELRVELYARMSSAGIGYENYARAIERPVMVGAKDTRSAGQAPFAVLAREYSDLNVTLAEEAQKYEASCRRLGLIASVKSKELPGAEESRERLARVLKALTDVREALMMKQGKMSVLEATDFHMGVVHALAKFRRPKAFELSSVADRRQLLAIQYTYQGIEQKLDEVRVEQLREIDEMALALRLAQESGSKDEIPELKRNLEARLQGTHSLFFVRRTAIDPDNKSVSDGFGSRYTYHLEHVWYRQIQNWMELPDTAPAEAGSLKELLDSLKPGVEAARVRAYPHGLVFRNVSLEDYSTGREN